MQKSLAILGATGSIGTQALQVAERLGYPVLAVCAHGNVQLLEEQIRRFRPQMAALRDEAAAADLRVRVADTATKIYAGEAGVCACAGSGADMVLNSIVGIAGLRPTLAAIAAGSDIALANKETLVAGAEPVLQAVRAAKVRLLPVDSEHSAIFQCLQGNRDAAQIKRLLLTASGGPFFGKSRAQLEQVTLQDALRHPNWEMGAKITVDSATMMNKGLELIEAHWLFGVAPQQIEVLVHRQSIVHSLVEFCDNSVIAQLGVPDMRIPIQYALTFPQRCKGDAPQLDLAQQASLTFAPPDDEAFPAISVCRDAIARGGLVPAVMNAANEAANALFREGKIRLLQIVELVQLVLAEFTPQSGHTVEDIFAADAWARAQTQKAAAQLS